MRVRIPCKGVRLRQPHPAATRSRALIGFPSRRSRGRDPSSAFTASRNLAGSGRKWSTFCCTSMDVEHASMCEGLRTGRSRGATWWLWDVACRRDPGRAGDRVLVHLARDGCPSNTAPLRAGVPGRSSARTRSDITRRSRSVTPAAACSRSTLSAVSCGPWTSTKSSSLRTRRTDCQRHDEEVASARSILTGRSSSLDRVIERAGSGAS